MDTNTAAVETAVETVPAVAVAAEAQTQSQAQEQAPAPVAKAAKAKVVATGNLIMDVATEVEALTKIKALNLADKLLEDIDNNSFRLGGVLKKIHENSWFDGSESFDAFVATRYGFQSRKARYLIEIYENLVTKNIPWEKVSHLGWTKLKDLARHLTLENLDEMVKKAENLTTLELQAMLKSSAPATEGAEKTTSDTQTLKFKVKNDQLETISSAIAKAKAEAQTEFDNVALEMICTGYLGGSVTAAGPVTVEAIMSKLGWEATLQAFDKCFPKINLTVEAPTEAPATEPAPA
jgi:hypothetical protein